MAKRRGFKAKSRAVTRFVKSRARKTYKSARGLGGMLGNTPIKPYSMAYGVVRTKIASVLDPLTSKIPAGEFADEIGIGLIAWFAGKKFPKLKPFAETALSIENYRVGELLAGRMGNNVKTTNTEW